MLESETVPDSALWGDWGIRKACLSWERNPGVQSSEPWGAPAANPGASRAVSSAPPSSSYETKQTCYKVMCACVQSCLTLCSPVDFSQPGSSVHGILQARLVQHVAISSSRESSWPRDQTRVLCVSCIARQILYHEARVQNPIPLLTFLQFKWNCAQLYTPSGLSGDFNSTLVWIIAKHPAWHVDLSRLLPEAA